MPRRSPHWYIMREATDCGRMKPKWGKEMKTSTKIFRIESALKDVDQAEEFARRIIHEAYSVGSQVSWWRGGIQSGTITYNSNHRCGDRFRVRNDATGKEYWITFYDLKKGTDT